MNWWYADLARHGITDIKPLVEWILLAIRDPQSCIGVPMRTDGFIHIGVLVK